MRKVFRPHATLAILLCLSACGGNSPPPPRFKLGDKVAVGMLGLPGQVVGANCASRPCNYIVRYLPPPEATNRDYRKDVFEEVELQPYPADPPK